MGDRRTGWLFVSRYLTLLVTEEICGRFGSFDGQTAAHIALLGFPGNRTDDGVSASLFGGFWFLMRLKHDRQFVPVLAGRDVMCRGSNVKDTLATAFQLESLILAQNERWRQA